MVNVKDMGGPVHPFAAGITVMVAIIAVIPLFDAVKEGIFPVPFAPSPMDGLLFVHVKVVPATGPLKAIGAVMTPSQEVKLPTGSADGIGFTIMTIGLEVAGEPVRQGTGPDVITTEIAVPLPRVGEVKVELVAPVIWLAPINH